MTFKTADRVFERSVTTGAGDYALGGAEVGFRPFNVMGAGNTCPYFATDDTNWEVGIGTILDSREIVLLAGANKRAAIERLRSGEVSEEFPASALWKHPNVRVVVSS